MYRPICIFCGRRVAKKIRLESLANYFDVIRACYALGLVNHGSSNLGVDSRY